MSPTEFYLGYFAIAHFASQYLKTKFSFKKFFKILNSALISTVLIMSWAWVSTSQQTNRWSSQVTNQNSEKWEKCSKKQ